MEVKDDILQVGSGHRDEQGQKLEPEQQPLTRIITGATPAAGTNGQQLGGIETRVEVATTAGGFAEELRSKCLNCKHFDRRRFAELKAALERTKEGNRQLNVLRAALMETGNTRLHDMHAGEDGEMDLDHAINTMGICTALTEEARDDVAVHPLSNCPPGKDLFKPRDRAAGRAGAAGYDRIMHLAEGGET